MTSDKVARPGCTFNILRLKKLHVATGMLFTVAILCAYSYHMLGIARSILFLEYCSKHKVYSIQPIAIATWSTCFSYHIQYNLLKDLSAVNMSTMAKRNSLNLQCTCYAIKIPIRTSTQRTSGSDKS